MGLLAEFEKFIVHFINCIKSFSKFVIMNVNQIVFSLLFLVFGMSLFAQKIERETRIDEENAPKNAVDFVNNLELNKHVKWYKEETSGRVSYESKIKYEDKFYSVEFDTLGNIEDIEVIIKFRDVDQKHKKAIKNEILNEFKKLKWIKVQKQFKGNKADLKHVFFGVVEDVELNYEVEVEVKTKENEWKLYEILINPEGVIQHMREIHLCPTDNLNY